MSNYNNIEKKNTGLLIGVLIIFSFIVLHAFILKNSPEFGPGKKGLSQILMGIEFIYLSLIILASYFFTNKSFLFRAIMKIAGGIRGLSQNRKCAFFWASFIFIFGILAILFGFGII